MTPACCPEWTLAQQRGTDNEGYGRLLCVEDGAWHIGNELKPVRFCPWCGAVVLPRADNSPVEGTDG